MKVLPAVERTDPTGRIVLWAQSPTWISTVRRLALPAPLVLALDLDDLHHELRRHWGSIGLVELTAADIVATCHWVGQHHNSVGGARWVGLAHPSLATWLPLVHAAGFAQAYWSVSQVSRLSRSIRLHFKTTPWPERDLESVIASQLPWGSPSRRQYIRSPSHHGESDE